MSRPEKSSSQLALWGQLRWFIRLRWGVGAGTILAALADWLWLGWYGWGREMLAVGVGILLYNAGLLAILRRRGRWARRRRALRGLAWVQILLDLACLTLLTLWTGGIHSPLLGFYVFHMVIASILLPELTAYGSVAVAGAMLTGALWLTDRWPETRLERHLVLGWFFTLLVTVYLASNITRKLRQHRRRLFEQRERIRSMSRRLRRQQQAIIQQDKMAAMGQMAAGVAHEIANPLACMDSLLQLARRKPERMGTEMVDTLREQVVRISEIVRQLTDFAHPERSGREVLSLQNIVEQAVRMIRYDGRVRKGRVRLELETGPGRERVSAHAHALIQVLVNLLLNALDATERTPEPCVRVRLGTRDGRCFVEIADNGHGIPPEHMGHLFEPFFTTKPVGKGTGLGLAISYRLVRSHGGDIRAERLENGSRFTVYLPAAEPVS